MRGGEVKKVGYEEKLILGVGERFKSMRLGAEGRDDGINCIERGVFVLEHQGRIFTAAGFYEIVFWFYIWFWW